MMMRKVLGFVAIVVCAASMAIAEPIKVACVGDSITAGVGAKGKGKNYPAQLGALLGEKYQVKNFGHSGIKMTNYMQKSQKAKMAQEFLPNIVVIKLGTNDTKGRKFDDPENKAKFAEQFTAAALEMIKAFSALESKPKIYMCTPVPVFQDKWGINEKCVVEDIIPMVNSIAKKTDCPVIDLYKALSGKGELVPDGVHPNAEGYKIIAETVAKVLKK